MATALPLEMRRIRHVPAGQLSPQATPRSRGRGRGRAASHAVCSKLLPPRIIALDNRELSPMAGARQYETDIAIVGAGGAGIAAGIEAREAGARAIAFENDSQPGGAAIISGGGCLIVGSPLQKQNGIHDTPDLAFKDW